MKNKSIKIALIGSYPPPYGGVSVHIERLKNKLDALGIDSVVYDFSQELNPLNKNIVPVKNPKKWFLKYFFTAKEDIIHSHMSDWRLRAAICLMGLFGKKTIISIHGASLHVALKEGGFFKRQIIKISLKFSSYIIALNPDIEKLCLSIGIKPNRIKVIPSFIPPIVDQDEIDSIPKEISDFVLNHNPIISANAIKVKFFNNQDLYGIDLCIDLCAHLKQFYPNIGFVFFLAKDGDLVYFEKMKKRLVENNIENNFFFVRKKCQFYPILMKSDVFVRPTNTDGDAVSIREALYFKIPTITSDVVQRPKEVTLFKNRDINDFISKTKYVLDNYELNKKKLEAIKVGDNFEKILKIYQNLANHKK